MTAGGGGPAEEGYDQVVSPDGLVVVAEAARVVSTHCKRRRLRFAHSLAGPYVAMSTISMGKDVYLLQFGASAQAIGAILLACSFLSPLMDSLMGFLQDSGMFFPRLFPSSSWGRRAPWHMTHTVVLAFLMFAFYLPPSYHQDWLHAWFGLIWLFGYWCVAASINAFEASRVEIYPFKEERVNVEQYCKMAVCFGICIGTGAGFLCLTFPSKVLYFCAGAIGCAAILTSLFATGVMCEANLPAAVVLAPGAAPLPARRRLVTNPIVLRMALLRFLSGSYETIFPSLQLYYLTYVFELENGPRLFWFAVGGVLIGASELVLAPLWAYMFTRSTKLMLWVPIGMRLIDCICAPLMLIVTKELAPFMAYLVVWRVCNGPYTFWRVAASAWVCDHDGGDREGQILGLFTMATNLGRALTAALAVLGLGWAGMLTKNCLQDGDKTACEHDKLYNQPASLCRYLQVMVAVAAPLLELSILLLTYEFPIRPGSKMLEDLLHKQSARSRARSGAGGIKSMEDREPDETANETTILEAGLGFGEIMPGSPLSGEMPRQPPPLKGAPFDVSGPPDSPMCEPPSFLAMKAMSLP